MNKNLQWQFLRHWVSSNSQKQWLPRDGKQTTALIKEALQKLTALREFLGLHAGTGNLGTGVQWTPCENMGWFLMTKTTRVFRKDYWRGENCTEKTTRHLQRVLLEYSVEYCSSNACKNATQWGSYHPKKLEGAGPWIIPVSTSQAENPHNSWGTG